MDPTQLAWAVGLFEGEGCITFRDKAHKKPYLKMSMTDFDVIRKFHKLIGRGNLDYIPKRKAHWQDQLQWRMGGKQNVRYVLGLFLPHLGDRRAHKALDILDLIECN